MGIGFEDIKVNGLKADDMSKIFNGVNKFYADYPQMKGFVKVFTTVNRKKDLMVAATTNSLKHYDDDDWSKWAMMPELKVNRAQLADFQALNEQQIATGFWVKTKDYTGTINHEMGHMINLKRTFDAHGINAGPIPHDRHDQYLPAMHDFGTSKVDDEVMREAFKSANIEYSKDNIAKYISRYGATDPAEAFAEAISNEDPDNVITKYVKQITKRELEKNDRTAP